MAKGKMICTFSDRLCEECALYRGRHYYLRFCKKYRGYLDESRDEHRIKYHTHPRISSNGQFQMPSTIITKAVDPSVWDYLRQRKGG